MCAGTDVEGLDLLPADFSYRHMDLVLDESGTAGRKVLAPLSEHYDLAVLDCPPSISLVSESVFGTADALLVPLILDADPAPRQLADFVDAEVDHQPDIVAFFSMVDQRKRLREVVESLPDGRADIVATAIPATEVELMGVERSPLVVHAPQRAAPTPGSCGPSCAPALNLWPRDRQAGGSSVSRSRLAEFRQ